MDKGIITVYLEAIKGIKFKVMDDREHICIPINNEIGTVVDRYVDKHGVVQPLKHVELKLDFIPSPNGRTPYILLPRINKEVMDKLDEKVRNSRPIIGNIVTFQKTESEE